MSLSQMSQKLLSLKEALHDCFGGNSSSKKSKLEKPRQLRIDTLEERLLLSVSVGNANDLMINQPNNAAVIPGYLTYQTTPVAGTNQSSAMNDQGDFVTTWSQEEPAWMRDENGVPIVDDRGYYQAYIDPITRQPVMESNVYARYFTDEVQRITLPDELISSGGIGRFSLRYGGNEVQRLTFSTANAPAYYMSNDIYYYDTDAPISGTFRIGGIKANGENQPESWVVVNFNESYGSDYCAKLLQEQLEGLGPYMKGVKVTATSSREFDIEFANNYWLDKDVPELQIQDMSFSTGFMAGAVVTTVNQPYDVSFFEYNQSTGGISTIGIPVDPNNPVKTAEYIAYAFLQFSDPDTYSPINMGVSLADETQEGFGAMIPSVTTFAIPEVRVSVIDAKTFEITFVNSTGKMNIPEMQVSSAKDGYGNEYVDPESIYLYGSYRYAGEEYANVSPVTTIKETSDAFRVNPVEVDDPLTPYPDVTYQSKPVVTMDNDGDFVIAWESEVKSFVVNPYNDYDIYAQRFTTQSVLEADQVTFRPDGKVIQGVRPVGESIKVNEYDNGMQTDPTISCDKDGNFVVGWTNYAAQDWSYFIGVKAKWFDRHGNALSGDVDISIEATTNTYLPHVAMSEDGYTVFAWDQTLYMLYKAVYAPGNYINPIVAPSLFADEAGEPSIAFDSNNRYVITYTTHWRYPGGTSDAVGPSLEEGQDIYLQMFEINTQTGAETQIRAATRMNSYDSGIHYTWHSQQLSSSVSVDADGDIIASYQGFLPDTDWGGISIPLGPTSTLDTKTNKVIEYDYFAKYVNSQKNADLIQYLSGSFDDGYYYDYSDYNMDYLYGYLYGIDPDSAIRNVLVAATNKGANADQLGRLNVVLESVLGDLRGDSSGVGYARLDADGIYGESFLVTDSIANDNRDGNNERILIALPNVNIESGAINLNITRYDSGISFIQEGLNIALAVNATPKTLNVGATTRNIRNAINGAWIMGGTTWQGNGNDIASCYVRYIEIEEQEQREGTAWELPYETGSYHLFEVTLIGGAHDTDFQFSFNETPGQIKIPDVDAFDSSGWVNIIDELSGSSGTSQISSSVNMNKAGSYTVVWAQENSPKYVTKSTYSLNYSMTPYAEATGYQGTTRAFVGANLFYRTFIESTDTAGPIVTDYYLPDGKVLENGDQITSALKDLVVIFDEQVRTTDLNLDKVHSVDNLNNWVLYKDGVEMKNGIENIQFALNASKDPAIHSSIEAVNSGSLTLGTSKWEAIVTFNGDSVNGALGPGQYTLRAKQTIADVAGNVLGKNGLNPNGNYYEITFNILPIDGYLGFDEGEIDDGPVNSDENIVNDGKYQDGNQYFRDDTGYEGELDPSMESTGRTVAGDAEGNFVVVWTSEVYKTDASGKQVLDEDASGIYLRKYRTKTVYGINGATEVEETIAVVKISSHPTAKQPTVGMDDDGDIIVAWAEAEFEGGDMDIYFSRYVENEGVLVSTTGTVRANTYTDDNQQHPSVSMSTEGDFVVVWESERQDGSGYGIYGQRFSPTGQPIGGRNDVQEITISGSPTGGTFRLSYTINEENVSYTWVSGEIAIKVNTFDMIEDIEEALKNMTPLPGNNYGKPLDLNVVVQAAGLGRITVQFVEEWGSQPAELLEVYSQKFDNAKPGMEITTASTTVGDTGEFRVNLTTENDQRFPSVAMAPGGDFVVTWTGWEISDTTGMLNADIFARTFGSSASMLVDMNSTSSSEPANRVPSANGNDTYIMSNDDPNNHLVEPGTGYDGVVQIWNDTLGGYGSGSLLSSGYHVLTAAHVVCDEYGNVYLPEDFVVQFDTVDGQIFVEVAQIYVYPDYPGDADWDAFEASCDLAIVQLVAVAPATVERYDIYRDSDELGQEATLVGYGRSGTAANGPDDTQPMAKRIGWNVFEITGSTWDTITNPNTLMYDFDDGTMANDLFGALFGIRDTGLALERESATAQGDSGGPAFINGKVAGVTSWGAAQMMAGGYGNHVRVSPYANWIDSIISGGGPEVLVNQITDGEQLWSDVAIDAVGNFVVTWTSFRPSPGGIQLAPASAVYARRFDATSNPLEGLWGGYDDGAGNIIYYNISGMEFLVSSATAANSSDQHQGFSKIDMTPLGDFVITWEGLSYRDSSVKEDLSFNISARRFVNSRDYVTLDQTLYINGYGYVTIFGAIGGGFFVSRTESGDQRAASVALDSNGDMVFVWQGESDRAANSIPSDDSDIVFRRITLQDDNSAPYVTDVIAVIKEEGKDPEHCQLLDGQRLEEGPTHLVVTLSEEVYNAYRMNAASILNPNNWILRKDGYNLPQAIVAINYYQPTVDPSDKYSQLSMGRNTAAEMGLGLPSSGKIEVVLTLDGDLSEEGLQALLAGVYELELKADVRDLSYLSTPTTTKDGNKLDGDLDGISGVNFKRTFYIGDQTVTDIETTDPTKPTDPADGTNDKIDPPAFNDAANNITSPAIAYCDDGSFVVVGVNETAYYLLMEDPDGEADDNGEIVIVNVGDIIVRRYDQNGVALGTERVVNTYTADVQGHPDVSMDKFGNFVVTWIGFGPDSDTEGVYARVYDAFGNPVSGQFLVTQDQGYKSTPKVALSNDGTFIITWIGSDPSAQNQFIYAKMFDFSGKQIGTKQFSIGSGYSSCKDVDIACNNNGSYAITWTANNTATRSYDIFAATFTANTATGTITTVRDTFRVNTLTNGQSEHATVAMSQNGDFVITWQSNLYSGSPDTYSDGVYARAFTLSGASISLLGNTSDKLINIQTKFDQRMPDVAFSGDGKTIVITWASYGQEKLNYYEPGQTYMNDFGVYMRILKRGAGGFVDTDYFTGEEIQVNRFVNFNQWQPVVGMDYDGDFSIAWVGPFTYDVQPVDADDNPIAVSAWSNVYLRSYRPNGLVSTTTNANAGLSQSGTYSAFIVASGKTGSNYSRYSTEYAQMISASSMAAADTTYVIAGTTGNDTIVIQPGSTSGTWTIKVNGKTQNVPANTETILYQGLGGSDTVTIIGTDGKESVIVNADKHTLSFIASGISFSGDSIVGANIDGAGGEDTISVTTSQGDDIVNLSLGQLLLTGLGLDYTAKNFENVKVISGGGRDLAILRDSENDDYLEMTANHAKMTGKNFSHEVSGFAEITAVSNKGNDTVVFNGSQYSDTLYADDYEVILRGGGAYLNSATGFKTAIVNGTGSGNTASIKGSDHGKDSLVSSGVHTQMNFAAGNSVSFSGFQMATIDAGAGKNSALLQSAHGFAGYDHYSVYVGESFQLKLNGFTSTTVQAANGVDAKAVLNVGAKVSASIRSLGRTTVLNADGNDLYHLIAFDQVRAKKDAGGLKGTIESMTDQLLALGDWE